MCTWSEAQVPGGGRWASETELCSRRRFACAQEELLRFACVPKVVVGWDELDVAATAMDRGSLEP